MKCIIACNKYQALKSNESCVFIFSFSIATMEDEMVIESSSSGRGTPQTSGRGTPQLSNPGTPRSGVEDVRSTPPPPIVVSRSGTPSMSGTSRSGTPAQLAMTNAQAHANAYAAVASAQQQLAQQVAAAGLRPQQSQSKYAQLLAVIEDMGKDIRPTYSGSKTSAERLKRGIVHARILVRECLMECERAART